MKNVRARRGRWLMLLALTALASGIAVIIVAIAGQRQAASPSPSAWGTIPGASDSPTPTAPTPAPATTSPRPATSGTPGTASAARQRQPAALPASNPVRISIPAIGVESTVFPIGKDASGGLQAPQPGPNLNNVGWYKYSPTPGQAGPAVLEGHVDTVHGPSVFLKLGALHPGDAIRVTRADGSIALFTVDAVRAYPSHADFPTQLVYGGDLGQPTVRLITCSNFKRGIGHYVGNTIVFAHLTGRDHA